MLAGRSEEKLKSLQDELGMTDSVHNLAGDISSESKEKGFVIIINFLDLCSNQSRVVLIIKYIYI